MWAAGLLGLVVAHSAAGTQEEGLRALWHVTGGPGWDRAWNQSAPYCEWYGVTCEANVVTALRLTANGLVGTVPSLAELPELTTLNLAQNPGLSGTIPPLVPLGQLGSLDLGATAVSGTVPATPASLRLFAASHSRLSGTLALDSFDSRTRALIVYNARLSGEIPWSIGRLSALEQLALGGNRLSGTIPGSIGQCSLMSALGLDQNRLSGSLPVELGRMSSMEIFLVFKNNIGSALPPLSFRSRAEPLAPGRLPSLLPDNVLLVHDNRLSCQLPNINNLNADYTLSILGNRISRPTPGWTNGETRSSLNLTIPSSLLEQEAQIITVVALGILVCLGLYLKNLGRKWPFTSNTGHLRRPVASLMNWEYRVAVLVTVVAIPFCALAMPCYITGANFYQCGLWHAKPTIAYLYNAPAQEWLIGSICFTWSLLTCGLILLQKRFVNYDSPPALASAKNDAWTKSFFWQVLSWTAFAFIMLLLGAPTLYYVGSHAFPEDNTLMNPNSLWIRLFSYGVYPLYLLVVNTLVLPLLAMLLLPGQLSGSCRMILLGRLLLLIFFPVFATMYLSPGCYQGYLTYWQPCIDNLFDFPSGCDVARNDAGSHDDPMSQNSNATFCVTQSDAVCTPHFRDGFCTRSLIELYSGVWCTKLLLAATLQPLALMCLYSQRGLKVRRLVRDGLRWCEFSYVLAAEPTMDLDRTWAQNLSNLELIVSAMPTLWGLDMRQVLVGPFVPIIVPIGAVVFWSTYKSDQWLVNAVYSNTSIDATGELEYLRPPLWYVFISPVLSAAFAAIAFHENNFAGWQLSFAACGIVGLFVLLSVAVKLLAPPWWGAQRSSAMGTETRMVTMSEPFLDSHEPEHFVTPRNDDMMFRDPDHDQLLEMPLDFATPRGQVS